MITDLYILLILHIIKKVYMLDDKEVNKTESVEVKYINNKNKSFKQLAFLGIIRIMMMLCFWKTF